MSFITTTSRCVPLLRDNIDTDQIIPAKFLSITNKKWLWRHVFWARRYNQDSTPNKDFVLNNSAYNWNILVTWENFWCGSSREHAVWALNDYGFNAIIALGFSDIFYNNALNNFVLPVVVDEVFHTWLTQAIQSNPTVEVTIDLPTQTVSYLDKRFEFSITKFKKDCLLSGQTNLDYLTSMKSEITEYEKHAYSF